MIFDGGHGQIPNSIHLDGATESTVIDREFSGQGNLDVVNYLDFAVEGRVEIYDRFFFGCSSVEFAAEGTGFSALVDESGNYIVDQDGNRISGYEL